MSKITIQFPDSRLHIKYHVGDTVFPIGVVTCYGSYACPACKQQRSIPSTSNWRRYGDISNGDVVVEVLISLAEKIKVEYKTEDGTTWPADDVFPSAQAARIAVSKRNKRDGYC